MQRWSSGRRILVATILAGGLDIAMAAIDTLVAGRSINAMLRGIANVAVPGAKDWGAAGASLGLAVHFAIMAVMASVFIVARDRIALIRDHTLAAAALYGLFLWLVMYGGVLGLYLGVPFPSTDAVNLAKQWFAHIVLVGLVIGLVAKR